MGFLFPCSDCEPLTRLTSEDTQHRSTEVRPDRTKPTPFPSQAAALYIQTLTFAFCKKRIFFTWKGGRESRRVLGRKVAVTGFWSNISVTETFPTPGFCLFLDDSKAGFPKFALPMTNEGISSSNIFRVSVSPTYSPGLKPSELMMVVSPTSLWPQMEIVKIIKIAASHAKIPARDI